MRIEWEPCRPTQKVCSPLRLVSYCTVIMPGSYGPDQLASMLRVVDGTTAARDNHPAQYH